MTKFTKEEFELLGSLIEGYREKTIISQDEWPVLVEACRIAALALNVEAIQNQMALIPQADLDEIDRERNNRHARRIVAYMRGE